MSDTNIDPKVVTKKNTSNEADTYLNSAKDFRPTQYEDFGQFLYHERMGATYKPSWSDKLLLGASQDFVKKTKCEVNVEKAINTRQLRLLHSLSYLLCSELLHLYLCLDPGVKLLLTAMKSVGWYSLCDLSANLAKHNVY